jgi:pyruvate-formate lyase-activating enzyme
MACRNCHSWEFTQQAQGEWMTPHKILEQAQAYETHVTLREPREKATSWHASDSCRCCGTCLVLGERSPSCPGVLNADAIMQSPQGYGPARNIVAFTGGDLACLPEFYGQSARFIKDQTRMWVIIETNGYGLTPQNLDYLRESGVDSFWLDIKAFDTKKHKWLTGTSNEHILTLPEEMKKRGFVFEALSLYIPDLVDSDELEQIARILMAADPSTPFTILAFFPEYAMREFPKPTAEQMVEAYDRVKKVGLENVRLGNIGVLADSNEDLEYLYSRLGKDAF